MTFSQPTENRNASEANVNSALDEARREGELILRGAKRLLENISSIEYCLNLRGNCSESRKVLSDADAKGWIVIFRVLLIGINGARCIL